MKNTLYVLSTLRSPEFGDCAIGHVIAHTSYAISDGATALKVKHFVVGHDWNWGKSDDITYLQNAKEFEQILSRDHLSLGEETFEIRYNFILADMIQKAKVFSDGDDELLTYIMRIIQDPNFQKDPQTYLSVWKEKRGLTEEWRIPEDRARMFFAKFCV